MQFFDLVAFPVNSADRVAERLGYKRMFVAGKDVELLEDAGAASASKKIIRSDDFETINRSLRQNSVLGIIPKSALPSGKALEAIKESEKLLFIRLCGATCADGAARPQELAKTRRLIRSALMGKVPFALVSLAESRECLMSSLQVLEVAQFLGVDAARAKEALGRLGGLI